MLPTNTLLHILVSMTLLLTNPQATGSFLQKKINSRNDGSIDINNTGLKSTNQTLKMSLENKPKINFCCERHKKLKTIGTSATGEEIILDVGHCKKFCKPQTVSTKELLRVMTENPQVDPREIYLSLASRTKHNSCEKQFMCEIERMRIETVVTAETDIEVPVIESCSCVPRPHGCKRFPKTVSFYKDTPLETTLDVGECRGHCNNGNECRATITKTVSVNGPNGAECIPVIKGCSCSGECYRVSHLQQLYDYSLGIAQVKEIDVGQCMGSCSNQQKKTRCMIRDDETDDTCLMFLQEKNSRCGAIKSSELPITDAQGISKNITVLDSCGCY